MNKHSNNARLWQVTSTLALSVSALLLASCGGSGGSSSAASLGGVAATGAPMGAATITVTCAAGPTLTSTTSATGSWSVNLDAASALPCIVKATGGTPPVTLYSLANSTGNVNVTPLTNLVVAAAAGSDPGAWVAANAGNLSSKLKDLANNLPAAKTAITQSLTDAGYTLPSQDFMTANFTPANGDPLDDLLEAVAKGVTDSGMTYADLVTQVAAAGTTVVTIPKSDVITASQVAAMPQLNKATVSVANGVASLAVQAGSNTVGAYVGGGNGNKAVLQLPGLEGMKLKDFREMSIDLRALNTLPTNALPDEAYLSVNIMVDLNCDATPLSATAKISEAQARRRILTFDPFYTALQSPATISSSFSTLTFGPATGGWRISNGAVAWDNDTGVEEKEHGAQYKLTSFNFTQYPNACIVSGASADNGMFRDKSADPSCNTTSGLTGNDLAKCGKTHSGAWLFIGHSGFIKAGQWEVRKVKVNERVFTFE